MIGWGPDLYLFTADGVYFRFCKKYHGDVHIPIMQAISRGFGGIGNVQRQGPIFYLNGKSLFTSWQELHDEIEVCGVLQDRVHLNPHQIHLHRRFHHQPHLEAVIHLDHPLVVRLNENVSLSSHVGNLSVVLVW